MSQQILRDLRRSLPLLVTLAVPGCASWTRMGTEPETAQSQRFTSVLDETAIFRRIGRLASGGQIPFIGNVALLPGAGDSVLAVLALSLQNRSFSFERQGTQGFGARYRVDLTLQRTGAPPINLGREETVRVTTFQETLRNDESVVFQEPILLAPGHYHLIVNVHDGRSDRQGRAEEDLVVTSFAPGTTTAPILVYDVTGRGTLSDPFRGLLNPRGAAGYGADTLTVLVEGYKVSADQKMKLRVVDSRDSVLLTQDLGFTGTTPLESRLLRFVPNDAPLGELKFQLVTDTIQHQTTALVSVSSKWIVSNYDEMLALLRYFGNEEQLAHLRKATHAERQTAWQDFYKDSDPNPATPENEALDAYFARLSVADQRYADEGEPGWRTERGEVFIVLGDPDEVIDMSATNQGRVVRWTYNTYRVALYFVDETGFGRFRLTPQSRADFDRVRSRVARAEHH